MPPKEINIDPEELSVPVQGNEMLVVVQHSACPLLHDQAPAVFSGLPLKVGSDIKAWSMGLMGFGKIKAAQRSIVASRDQFYSVPRSMSEQDACSYAAALLTTIAILKHELEIIFTASHNRPERSVTVEQSGPRIVIIGGETLLGVALAQVLVRTRPDARILVLSSMSDQHELFQRVSQLARMGAWYAIDGDTPDLMEYAGLAEKGGTEFMISAVERESVREDLRMHVDCYAVESTAAVGELDLQDQAFTGAVHRMVVEAADEFAKYQEPPACGFADSDD